ncbi:MAG: flagellar basal body L-ring protein FlgH [Desulfobacterales bacterium]|nr:flagellar basal body L-ring protein FlgH [Desulfobacterales bacterium]
MKSSLANRFRAICRPLVLLAAAGLPWGCVTTGPAPVVVPPSMVEVPAPAPAPPAEGSLWQDSAPLNDMFANVKARQVGDIVTVRIVESASASNKATTSAGRKSSISGGIESFFNLEKKFPSTRDTLSPFGSVAASLSNDFDGDGETTRSGDLTAYVSARVTGITANGNLMIAGFREVTVNNEQQLISLTGVVRPKDVTPDNVVLSTYVADARIVYSGTGIVNDKQRPGWLARTLDQVWPF